MWIFPVAIAILLILTLSLFWTHPRGGPWIPSSRKAVRQMLDLAQIKPGELVYDLGCGDGRIIIAAAKKYHARAVGIELDPIRWLWCQLLITLLGLRGQVRIIYGDLFQQNLSKADVVVCYLLPEATRKLQDKLLRELQPQTRVVSNTFIFPGIRERAKNGKARLYLFSPENTMAAYIKEQLEKSSREEYP
ncbi:MAG: SAM-dependent methyltransferase [Chloroflexi bacterium]|nr:MAG: SAM-dependent methyltransferase [Chloroflexota bacterium]